MSQQYDDSNRGALFKNQKKVTDKHPDYNGSINVGGADYWISAWLKESQQGTKYMSLSVQPKDQQKTSAPQQSRQSAPPVSTEDIPF